MKNKVFENDYVTGSDTSKRACSYQRWYIAFSCGWTGKNDPYKKGKVKRMFFALKKDENFSVFKQKAYMCGKGLNGLCKIKFLTLV